MPVISSQATGERKGRDRGRSAHCTGRYLRVGKFPDVAVNALSFATLRICDLTSN